MKKFLALSVLTLFLAPLHANAANNSNFYEPPCKRGDIERNDVCYQRLHYRTVIQGRVNARERIVTNPDFARTIRVETSRTRQRAQMRNNARQSFVRSQQGNLVKGRNLRSRSMGIRTRPTINRETILPEDREVGWRDGIGRASRTRRTRTERLDQLREQRRMRRERALQNLIEQAQEDSVEE